MKRILLTLLCLFSFSLFAQQTTIQVMLKPGYSFGETTMLTNCTTCTNDGGLNQIISSYVNQFQSTDVMIEDISQYDNKLGLIHVDPSSAVALVNDLNAYSAVVYNASIEQIEWRYNYGLSIRISDLTNGNYVATDSNGIIVTSNAQLNQIFQQFNVNFFELGFPGVPALFNVFVIGCQFCDTINLKTALEGLEGTVLVDESTDYIPYILLLNTDSNVLDKKLTLFPNPTSGVFEIKMETQFQDVDVELYDSNGRIVFKNKFNSSSTNSKAIDISSLSNGVYFLKVKNDEFTQTEKIVKQ